MVAPLHLGRRGATGPSSRLHPGRVACDGTIRRDGLENVIVLHERHLRELLSESFDYHHRQVHSRWKLTAAARRVTVPPVAQT